jgi:hypothetical protein
VHQRFTDAVSYGNDFIRPMVIDCLFDDLEVSSFGRLKEHFCHCIIKWHRSATMY